MKLRCILVALTLALVAAPASALDRIVVAVNKLSAGSPLYIARAKGYFDDVGLDVSLLHQTSAQAIGMAVLSGDAPIGMTALTAGIYTIAGKGGMKIVAGGLEEMPGFKGLAILVNRAVYERGVRKPADLVGLRIGTTQWGSPQENQMARLAKKYGFNYSDMKFVPLQTLANLAAAIKGGQVDAIIIPATLARQIEETGAAVIMAWIGDEAPAQLGGIFANANTIAQRPDVVTRFLRAYLKAIAYYDRAFQQKGADGNLVKGDNYDDALKIIADYLGEPAGFIASGLPYFRPGAPLEMADLAEQIAIWKALNQIDPDVTLAKATDESFLAAANAPGN